MTCRVPSKSILEVRVCEMVQMLRFFEVVKFLAVNIKEGDFTQFLFLYQNIACKQTMDGCLRSFIC